MLLDDEQVSEMRQWGTNVHAYRLAREADTYQRIQTVESLDTAERLYQLAIVEDPKFTYGYVSLADVYWAIAQTPPDTQMRQRARRDMQALLRDAKTQLADLRTLAIIERQYRSLSVGNAFDAEAAERPVAEEIATIRKHSATMWAC